jgi:hypothetical protein
MTPKLVAKKPLPKRADKKAPPAKDTRLELLNHNLSLFPPISRPHITFLDLTGNLITDFVGLPPLRHLTQLILDGNRVHSFKGCCRLPNLLWLSLRGNPITRSVHFKLMCLIAFGDQLISVNAEKIPEQFKIGAKDLNAALFPELVAGKVISRLRPLTLIDMTQPTPQVMVAKEEEIVSAATKVTGYLSPADHRKYQARRTGPAAPPPPSLAALCEDFVSPAPTLVTQLPDEFVQSVAGQVAAIRKRFSVYTEEEKVAAPLCDCETQSGEPAEMGNSEADGPESEDAAAAEAEAVPESERAASDGLVDEATPAPESEGAAPPPATEEQEEEEEAD